MLIYILQEVLQGYEEHLGMEDKVPATILNRSDKNKTGQKNNKRARNNNLLNNAISPLLKSNHDWLGALTLKNVVIKAICQQFKEARGVYEVLGDRIINTGKFSYKGWDDGMVLSSHAEKRYARTRSWLS